jgi:hypothetical protein
VDRAWWAHIIRRADIVDRDIVSWQVGRPISARAAVRRYVRGGFREGFALNLLFMESTVSRQLSDSDRVPALYAYLVNDRAELRTSPSWDATALVASEPDALAHRAGPLGFAWHRAQREGWVELGAEAPTRVAWKTVVASVMRPPVSEPLPADGTVLICVVGAEERQPDDGLVLAARAASELDADVDLVLTGSAFDVSAQATIVSLWSPRLRVRHAPPGSVTDPPAATRAGLTVFRGPGARLSFGALRALVDAGADGSAAALWLDGDGTVASAGTVYHSGRSVALLAGHPPEDARRVGPAIDVPQLAGPARAWPAGADPSGPGRTITFAEVWAPLQEAPPTQGERADTDVDAILAPAGLAVARWESDRPVLRRIAPRGSTGLRWSIKTAAPAGTAGATWGDTHFARGIAAALTRIGQEVTVDAFDARARTTTYLDDVSLVLRGPHRIDPPATGRRLLWIISHPDEISAAELDGFDAIFAASTPWAKEASIRFGRPIHPLLQCTDATRFQPSGQARTDEIVFVGTARGIARPAVVGPIAAGIPVDVYGPDWRGYIPGSRIAGTGIPNDDLPRLYERATVVLNDHWPAMQAAGFISNRPYDVVAAGGRMLSDRVAGIDEYFGGAVRTYKDVDELVGMLRGDLNALFPSDERVLEVSARIRRDDSFDARARRLLDAALDAQQR